MALVVLVGANIVGVQSPLGAWASAGTYDFGADATYSEDGAAQAINADFSLSNAAGNYAGGNVSFLIDGTNETGETLSFTESTPSTANGVISFQNGTVFKGNGTSAQAIGNVDGTLNGRGTDLKVNFSNAFSNGDFSSGASGWTVTDSRVYLGYVNSAGTTVPASNLIGGFAPPVDKVWGPLAKDRNIWDIDSASNGFQTSSSGNLTMTVTNGSCPVGGCVVRGPYVVSDSSVFLAAGDTVSFSWSAAGSGDAFDVYGYLLNTQSGKMVKLLDETGNANTSASGTVSATLGSARATGPFVSGSARTDLATFESGSWGTGASSYDDRKFTDGTNFEAGTYKFVFIAGSYDDTGGKVLGASFTIDNVAVSSSAPATVTGADI